MTNYVYLDFETRSRADLKKVGAAIYSEDESTDVLCAGYGLSDGKVYLYSDFEEVPDFLRFYASKHDYVFVAHNAPFEQWIWKNVMVKKYGYPELPIERWQCTMALCHAHGLPGGLGAAAHALGLPQQKDMAGHAAMMKLCKPNKQGEFWTPETAPEDFETLYKYCPGDVEVTRAIHKRLRPLSAIEQRVWQIDQRINQEGVRLDIPVIRKIVEFKQRYAEEVKAAFRTVGRTGISPTQKAAVKDYLELDENLKLKNMQKATVIKALAHNDTSAIAKDLLKLMQEANKTSLAKFDQMLRRSSNGILRDLYVYAGAHTLRWTGSGVQLHNMARPKGSLKIDAVLQDINDFDYDWFSFLYADVAATISNCTRGVIISEPGSRLFIADLKQIEARILAWLAGQEDKLQQFRDGQDIYQIIADDIGVERQGGKVADLALGFGGGINAMATMASSYSLDLTALHDQLRESVTLDEFERAQYSVGFYFSKKREEPVSFEVAFVSDILKQRWRRSNKHIQQFWFDTETAAVEAVRTKKPVACGKCTWFVHDIFLFCKLPSGGCISHPYPEVDETTNAYAGTRVGKLSYYGKIQGTSKWGRVYTYGGKLTENIVQATAREVEARAMVRLEKVCRVRMHTHDDLVAQVPINSDFTLKQFSDIIEQREKWSEDIPIEVDAYESQRYGTK